MNYQHLRGIASPATARLTVSLAALAMVAGCSTLNDAMQADKIDYKSNAKRTATLEVPPDLTSLQGDRRYAAPEAGGAATLSGYQQRVSAQQATGTVNALPAAKGMRIERDGNQRWLVVDDMTASQVWPILREFWQENGFLLSIDSPETGIMETDWAENRAKIPQDFIRNTIGKVFDSLYSTSERDRFRTRVEKGANGKLEVFISHRGAREELTGLSKESTVWVPRQADPELEAEFLSRLMQRLGMSREAAQATMAAAGTGGAAAATGGQAPATAPSLIRQVNGVDVLSLNEPFDRAWRSVGLALDRVNFTVEDRDRANGVYFVRYVDTRDQAKQPGFFSRLFSRSKAEEAKRAKRYRVAVQGSGNNGSVVSVLNDSGAPEKSDINRQILTLLNEQLR